METIAHCGKAKEIESCGLFLACSLNWCVEVANRRHSQGAKEPKKCRDYESGFVQKREVDRSEAATEAVPQLLENRIGLTMGANTRGQQKPQLWLQHSHLHIWRILALLHHRRGAVGSPAAGAGVWKHMHAPLRTNQQPARRLPAVQEKPSRAPVGTAAQAHSGGGVIAALMATNSSASANGRFLVVWPRFCAEQLYHGSPVAQASSYPHKLWNCFRRHRQHGEGWSRLEKAPTSVVRWQATRGQGCRSSRCPGQRETIERESTEKLSESLLTNRFGPGRKETEPRPGFLPTPWVCNTSGCKSLSSLRCKAASQRSTGPFRPVSELSCIFTSNPVLTAWPLQESMNLLSQAAPWQLEQ